MNLPQYAATYSSGDNANAVTKYFVAEQDSHAVAIAILEAPPDATAWNVKRVQTTWVSGGAIPANRSALMDELKQVTERYTDNFTPEARP